MNAIAAGVIRHALTALGGAGALEGVASSDPIVTFVSVGAIIAGTVWSFFKNKKKSG